MTDLIVYAIIGAVFGGGLILFGLFLWVVLDVLTYSDRRR